MLAKKRAQKTHKTGRVKYQLSPEDWLLAERLRARRSPDTRALKNNRTLPGSRQRGQEPPRMWNRGTGRGFLLQQGNAGLRPLSRVGPGKVLPSLAKPVFSVL